MDKKYECLQALIANKCDMMSMIESDDYKGDGSVIDCHRNWWFVDFVPVIKQYGLETVNEVIADVYERVLWRKKNGENQ